MGKKQKANCTQEQKEKNIHQVLLQYLQVMQEWSAPLVISCFSRDRWLQNRPFTDQNQISVMGPAAVNGSHVGGCLRGVRLSPPRVISAWWPLPRRHQRVADVICSHSAVTWRNGNQRWRWEGGLRQKESERSGQPMYLSTWHPELCKACRKSSLLILLRHIHTES